MYVYKSNSYNCSTAFWFEIENYGYFVRAYCKTFVIQFQFKQLACLSLHCVFHTRLVWKTFLSIHVSTNDPVFLLQEKETHNSWIKRDFVRGQYRPRVAGFSLYIHTFCAGFLSLLIGRFADGSFPERLYSCLSFPYKHRNKCCQRRHNVIANRLQIDAYCVWQSINCALSFLLWDLISKILPQPVIEVVLFSLATSARICSWKDMWGTEIVRPQNKKKREKKTLKNGWWERQPSSQCQLFTLTL